MSRRRRRGSKAAPGSEAKGARRRRDSAHSLKEAVRRGRHGQVGRAVRLAREAVATAATPAQHRAAQRVLGEATLQAALDGGDPAEALERLEDGLRADPGSPRLALYRALALLRLGRIDEGLAALEGSLAAGAPDLPAGWEHARQLARLAAGERGAVAGLSDAESVELGLVEALLMGRDRSVGGAPGSVQLGLFGAPVRGDGPDSGSDDEAPLTDLRVWPPFLAMSADPDAAPVDDLEVAAEAAPGAAPIIRYYRAVAELRRGNRAEALEAIRSAAAEGLDTPWLRHNLILLLRGAAQELAETERWEDLARFAGRIPAGIDDRILAETVALAHEHLGHQAAQGGRWAEAANHWRRSEGLVTRRTVAQNLALAEEALENWEAAAQAWRAMARRRPRSPDHADYLPDDQVAALWSHAAECYGRAAAVEDAVEEWEEAMSEALTCVETALKYAPEDTALRLERAELLFAKDSQDAAAAELDRVLERDPRHLEALKLRAAIEEDRPWGDPAPLLRRALEVAPQDQEAREALAASYLGRVPRSSFFRMFAKDAGHRERIRTLKEGLEEVPEHAGLLTALGHAYRLAGKGSDALATLRRALAAARRDTSVAADVLHELVHAADGEEGPILEAVIGIRGMEGIRPGFWIGQAGRVLECELPSTWFHRFLDEALSRADRTDVEDSRASVLFRAWNAADEVEAGEVAGQVEARIREEAAASGAVQIIEAERRLLEHDDVEGARRLLRQAEQRARRAGDEVLLEIVEQRQMVTLPAGDMLRMLGAFFR